MENVMKKCLFLVASVLSLTFCSVSFAEETKAPAKGQPRVAKPKAVVRPGSLRPPKRTDVPDIEAMRRQHGSRSRMSRSMMHKQQMDQFSRQYAEKESKHKAFLAKLENILELANKENATKTAESVQKLIDEAKKDFTIETKPLLERKRQVLDQIKKVEEREGQAGIIKPKIEKAPTSSPNPATPPKAVVSPKAEEKADAAVEKEETKKKKSWKFWE
jgi:hypothetical protein